MRIVGGSNRGRPLRVPEGETVRPTSDRARESLFNILEHGVWAANGSPIAGARVLDAFAGTGALGLEALSRGAGEAVFLERSPRALTVLEANVTALGERARATILRGDATRPPKARASATLAFLDPPYGQGLGSPALIALASTGWFARGAIIILELAAKELFEPPPGFVIADERRYGAARLLFMRYAAQSDAYPG